MPTMNLLNLKEIQQLIDEMGDAAAEIIDDLVNSLENDAVRSLGEMHDAIDQGDAQQLRKSAHRLKGSCASLGAVQAASLCQELEALGGSGNIEQAAPIVEYLETVCADSIHALRELSL